MTWLFVRTKEVQGIGRLPPADLGRALEARWGGQFVRLAEQAARPPAGRIGYWIAAERTVFSRISDTGRRLYVEVEDGRIARHNLERMAKVF